MFNANPKEAMIFLFKLLGNEDGMSRQTVKLDKEGGEAREEARTVQMWCSAWGCHVTENLLISVGLNLSILSVTVL